MSESRSKQSLSLVFLFRALSLSLLLASSSAASLLVDPVPTFTSAAAYTCVPVNNTAAICNVWGSNSVPVLKNGTTAASFQGFDTALANWAVGTSGISDFNTKLGCNWDGAGLQYQLTYACAVAIVQHRECQPAGGPPMCRTACLTYLDSLATIISSPSICPSAGDTIQATRQAVLSDVAKICASGTASSTNPACIPAVTAEVGRCGFVNYDVAVAYCNAFSGSSNRSSCCDSLSNTATQYGPSFGSGSASPLFLGSLKVNGSGGSNAGAVAGAVIGVLLFLGLVGATVFYVQRRHPSVIMRIRKRLFTMTFSRKQWRDRGGGSLSRGQKPMAVMGDAFAGQDITRKMREMDTFAPKEPRHLTDGNPAPPWMTKGDVRAPSLFNVMPSPPDSPARLPGNLRGNAPNVSAMEDEAELEMEWGQDAIPGRGPKPKGSKSKKAKRQSSGDGYMAEESGMDEGAVRKGSKKDKKKKPGNAANYTMDYNDPAETDEDGYALPEHDPYDPYDSEYLGSDYGDQPPAKGNKVQTNEGRMV